VVKPSLRKKMAYEAVTQKAVSIRFACDAFQISETCYRYQHQSEDDNALIADWLIKLTMRIAIGDLVCALPTFAM
jgi:putative transposase